jgi:hypothetical protein
VLSVAAGGADGPEAGGFVERLAIGAAAKRDGVFELKRGAIRPVALKARERGVASYIMYRFENSHRRSLAVSESWFAVNNSL